MIPLAWSFAILCLMAPVRGLQMLRAWMRKRRELSLHRSLQAVYKRRSSNREYEDPQEEQLDKRVYELHFDDAARALERRDQKLKALLQRLNLTWYFAKRLVGLASEENSLSSIAAKKSPLRWLGFTSFQSGGLTALDVVTFLVLAATFARPLAHWTVDRVGDTGQRVWATAKEAPSKAVSTAQKFGREKMFDIRGTDAPKSDVAVQGEETDSLTATEAPTEGTDASGG